MDASQLTLMQRRVTKTLQYAERISLHDLQNMLQVNRQHLERELTLLRTLIQIQNDGVFLTPDGQQVASRIDGQSFEIYQDSVDIIFLVARRVMDQHAEYLMLQRTKHPHWGRIGFPGEKMESGEGILEAAQRGLLEETGLTAKNVQLLRTQPKRQHGFQEDGNVHIVILSEFSGQVRQTNEGKPIWMTEEQIDAYVDTYDDVHELIALTEDSFAFEEGNENCNQLSNM